MDVLFESLNGWTPFGGPIASSVASAIKDAVPDGFIMYMKLVGPDLQLRVIEILQLFLFVIALYSIYKAIRSVASLLVCSAMFYALVRINAGILAGQTTAAD